MYSLESAYPVLRGRLKRWPLLKGYTPVKEISGCAASSLWIKRDDLTHAVYGGNKVRKLELILGRARDQGVKRLVTFGAAGTHHGVATAYFAREADLATTLILFDQPSTPSVALSLQLMASLGAEIWYRRSLAATVLSYALEAPLRHPQAMRLFAGGSCVEGGLAFINAAFELADQVEAGTLPRPDHMVVAVGSAATLAGLAAGIALLGWPTRITGVRVAPAYLGPWQVCTAATVQTQVNRLRRYLQQSHIHLPEVHFFLDEEEYGAGYGRATDAGKKASQHFQAVTGLSLDVTYTAKAFAAALRYQQKFPDENLLYWHTLSSADPQPLIKAEAVDRLPAALRRNYHLAL